MILQVREIDTFYGLVHMLRGISLDVAPGEVVALLGRNGAGKTTVIKSIMGLAPPRAGRIVFKGEDITGLPPERICRKGIAKTFQIARSFPGLSALDSVMVGAIFGNPEPLPRREAGELSAATLDFVGFPAEKRETMVKNLNVVELKKVQLARALASKPRLLLFDELMTGLTPTESNDSVELVKRVQATGVSILMIEHVMSVILGVSDRVIVLDHGEKIADGHPYEVVNNQRVIDSYLGDVCAF